MKLRLVGEIGTCDKGGDKRHVIKIQCHKKGTNEVLLKFRDWEKGVRSL